MPFSTIDKAFDALNPNNNSDSGCIRANFTF
jgi:hypothetical protein